MQEIEDRESQTLAKKWTSKEEQLMRKLIKDGASLEEAESKFQRHKKEDITKKYEQMKVPPTIENDDPLL
jgi:hypothetical protein